MERGREFFDELWRRNDMIRFGHYEDEWFPHYKNNPNANFEKTRRVNSIRLFITSLSLWAVTVVAAQNIEVVVHRGANALAPENTVASADSALKYGATWVEVDVRPSRDGVLFNLHDETLDRTTNGTGRLVDMLAADVHRLDAGSWFSPQFAGQHVPTIAEMLDSLQGRAKVFFDVKRGA